MTVSDAAALADELHAFCAAAPHDYPGHNIELFERVESFLRTLIPSDSASDAALAGEPSRAAMEAAVDLEIQMACQSITTRGLALHLDKIAAALRTPIPVAVSRDTNGAPVAWLLERQCDPTFPRVMLSRAHADALVAYVNVNPPVTVHPLYAAPLPAVAVSREEVDAARLYHTLMGLTSLVLSRFPSAARLWKQGGVPVVQDAIDAIETFKRYDEDSALRTPVSREEVARIICKSGKFETGQGTCALICMDQLGAARRDCHHKVTVHAKLVDAILSLLRLHDRAAPEGGK